MAGASIGRLTSLYTRLLAINAEAMQDGLYEVAFYALSGAMYAIEEPGDPGCYDAVARLAEEQGKSVDDDLGRAAPSGPITGRKAASAFRLLSLQARAHALLARRRAAH
jgi:hypothetical protein